MQFTECRAPSRRRKYKLAYYQYDIRGISALEDIRNNAQMLVMFRLNHRYNGAALHAIQSRAARNDRAALQSYLDTTASRDLRICP